MFWIATAMTVFGLLSVMGMWKTMGTLIIIIFGSVLWAFIFGFFTLITYMSGTDIVAHIPMWYMDVGSDMSLLGLMSAKFFGIIPAFIEGSVGTILKTPSFFYKLSFVFYFFILLSLGGFIGRVFWKMSN